MFKWITWGMIVLGIGIVILVLGKFLIAANRIDPFVAVWFRMISTFIMLGGTGMAAFGVLNAMRRGASLSTGRRPSELAEPVNTKELPTNPIPAPLPSVTERTTQLIPVDVVTKSEVKAN